MKVDLNTLAQDLEGENILEGEKTVTLGLIAKRALLADNSDKWSAKEKEERFDLMIKIKDGGKLDITKDEAIMIEESVAKMFPPLISGQFSKLVK